MTNDPNSRMSEAFRTAEQAREQARAAMNDAADQAALYREKATRLMQDTKTYLQDNSTLLIGAALLAAAAGVAGYLMGRSNHSSSSDIENY